VYGRSAQGGTGLSQSPLRPHFPIRRCIITSEQRCVGGQHRPASTSSPPNVGYDLISLISRDKWFYRCLVTIPRLMRSLFTALALAGMLPVDASAGSIIPGYPDSVETSFDSREVALLPHYCMYTKLFRMGVPGGDNKAEIDRWRAMMGPAFDWMH